MEGQDHILGCIFAAPRAARFEEFSALCGREPAILEYPHLVGAHNPLRFAARDTGELDLLLEQIKTFGNSRTAIELKTCFGYKLLPKVNEPH